MKIWLVDGKEYRTHESFVRYCVGTMYIHGEANCLDVGDNLTHETVKQFPLGQGRQALDYCQELNNGEAIA